MIILNIYMAKILIMLTECSHMEKGEMKNCISSTFQFRVEMLKHVKRMDWHKTKDKVMKNLVDKKKDKKTLKELSNYIVECEKKYLDMQWDYYRSLTHEQRKELDDDDKGNYQRLKEYYNYLLAEGIEKDHMCSCSEESNGDNHDDKLPEVRTAQDKIDIVMNGQLPSV